MDDFETLSVIGSGGYGRPKCSPVSTVRVPAVVTWIGRCRQGLPGPVQAYESSDGAQGAEQEVHRGG